MSTDEKMIFKIRRDGSVTIDAQGFHGSACMDATKAFEAMFADVSMKPTSDYFLEEVESEKVLVKEGTGSGE